MPLALYLYALAATDNRALGLSLRAQRGNPEPRIVIASEARQSMQFGSHGLPRRTASQRRWGRVRL